MWDKIKKSLIKQETDIGTLSLSLVNDNETLLSHLFDQLNKSVVEKALRDNNIQIYSDAEQTEPIYTNSTFVIYKNGVVYATNPFSPTTTFAIKGKAKELKVSVSKIGYISKEHTIFSKNKAKSGSKGKKDESLDIQNKLYNIFSKASKNEVSDIHILPRNNKHMAIIFEQHGMAVESGIDDIEIEKDYNNFANYLTTLAGDNGGSFQQFLEKQIDYKDSNNIELEVRLQRNPLVQKFKNGKPLPEFILRVHNKKTKSSLKELDDIGLFEEQFKLIAATVKNNSGVVIVAGPTGSGKTTVLHAALESATATSQKSKSLRLAKTFEDPVEIQTTRLGITQTNINKRAGITYESAIEAILRSKKSIALLGETRSAETAKGIIALDMVGHLVLTTMHAKTTMSIIERLREFGIKNEHIADSISLIISTRLVQKVCPNCSNFIDVEEINRLNAKQRSSNQKDYYTIQTKYQGNKGIGLTDRITIANNEGCCECLSGYQGRMLVAETVLIDNTMRRLIIDGASNQEFVRHVEKHGNKSIWDHGFHLLKKGKTTLEALELVMPNYSDYGNNFSVDTEVAKV